MLIIAMNCCFENLQSSLKTIASAASLYISSPKVLRINSLIIIISYICLGPILVTQLASKWDREAEQAVSVQGSHCFQWN